MPEFISDVLEVIPDSEIPQVIEQIKKDLPISRFAYGTLTTNYLWRKQDPNYKVEFYRLRENDESGVFVGILYSGNKTFGVIPYAKEGYENDLEQVLMNTKVIDWEGLPIIEGVIPRHSDLIERVIRKKKYTPKLYVNSLLLDLDINKALKLNVEVPENMYIRRLIADDVSSIYESWPLKDMYTIDEIKYAIELGFSYGVFAKENDEIKAWVMQCHYGAIGMLYTKEDVRRHGYAKTLVLKLSQELAKLDITPYASIVATNFKSLSLFNAIGFKQFANHKYFNVIKND